MAVAYAEVASTRDNIIQLHPRAADSRPSIEDMEKRAAEAYGANWRQKTGPKHESPEFDKSELTEDDVFACCRDWFRERMGAPSYVDTSSRWSNGTQWVRPKLQLSGMGQDIMTAAGRRIGAERLRVKAGTAVELYRATGGQSFRVHLPHDLVFLGSECQVGPKHRFLTPFTTFERNGWYVRVSSTSVERAESLLEARQLALIA